MADYTAIYALGHMSISMSRSEHHQMVPFWAPFLLLHLGGPDTITAYAFQDNQLWLRHLLTLAAQVLGAAYVMYLFVTAGRNPAGTLVTAAALMFVAGCLKYGERTWALKCGGMHSIASSVDDGKSLAARGPYHGREGEERLDSEEVLLGAHYMINVCKGVLATDWALMDMPQYETMRQGIQLNGGKYLFELAAMELSLLYDILYTKAAVIHTWHGFCIRIVSPLSTVAAFVLFHLSSKNAYGRADVAVTYVLLAGAMGLELASSLGAAVSSWACAYYHARGWQRLCGAVMRVRRILKDGARRSGCLDSLGQYNMLDICTDADKDDLRGKVSNHMMFLMVVHPYLLPVVVRNDRYKQNLKYFESLWWDRWKTKKEDTKNMSRSEIVKKIAEFKLPAHSWHKYISGSGEESSYDYHGRAVYIEACWLAGMLLGNRWRLTFADMLEVIAGVWVEMMCYAIHYCGEESHAKKLSTGAEFISVVWLIIEHAILNDNRAPSERLTGGLDPFKSERKRKRPATDPGATLYPSLWVDRRGINGVPPGVNPAYSIFF